MYRRAQNGAVGSAARPDSPASTAPGWLSTGGAEAEPGSGRVAAYLLSYDHPTSGPGWSGVTAQVAASVEAPARGRLLQAGTAQGHR